MSYTCCRCVAIIAINERVKSQNEIRRKFFFSIISVSFLTICLFVEKTIKGCPKEQRLSAQPAVTKKGMTDPRYLS